MCFPTTIKVNTKDSLDVVCLCKAGLSTVWSKFLSIRFWRTNLHVAHDTVPPPSRLNTDRGKNSVYTGMQTGSDKREGDSRVMWQSQRGRKSPPCPVCSVPYCDTAELLIKISMMEMFCTL